MRIVIPIAFVSLILSACTSETDSSQDPLDLTQQEQSPASEAMGQTGTRAESPAPASSSRLSLDWAGTYSGEIPCANCPGIKVRITLNDDGTFERSLRYIDESPIPTTDSGSFTWNSAGSIVTLSPEQGESQSYQVGEHRLFHLDSQDQRIEGELAGHYVLHQHMEDSAIEDRRWRLTELNGQPVDLDDLQTEPFLLLDSEAASVHGSASCNTFNGSYAIKTGQQIEFGQNFAMTMMACPDMAVEQQFIELLRTVDNYSISDDGYMTLNRARMAPLARFVEERQTD